MSLEGRTTMVSFHCKLHFSVTSILIYLDLCTAQPTLINYVCLGNNYTSNSPFNYNINLLLSSLSSASLKNGFYNTTAGQNPYRVYGIFLCRGDVTPGVCQSCIMTASEEIKQACPTEEESIIWYEKCMLRYSTSNIFSNLAESPEVDQWETENVTDLEYFNQILGVLMNNLVSQASSSSSTDMFAANNEYYNSFQRIYGLVQCTPDISHSDCNRCLIGSLAQIHRCCSGSRSGGIFRPSCNLMYSTDSLYQLEADGSAPPPLSKRSAPPPLSKRSAPPPSSKQKNSTDRKKSNSLHIVVIITVPTVVIMILLFITCFFYVQRKNRKRKINLINKIETTESLRFSFSTIKAATNDFSDNNKLGVGGFGVVYKVMKMSSYNYINFLCQFMFYVPIFTWFLNHFPKK
ncbi:hypothetical protein NE237_025027 [Protea cynaroides]|uniref:Gnk2-homologous domain-containing protein n=1 Tax=Protea cynaroides TaxID=273540 RepID=A0A9Q0JZR7_9MAGN|nr:hypothetical protein NE237_025027 [Protea cynaroides]